MKCLTTNLKELKVDWGVKDPRYYFDTIELLRSMFHDVNSGQLPVAVVLFMTNSLEPENQTGSFKEHRSRSLQQHYVNNFFTFLDTTIREALRNEHQVIRKIMIYSSKTWETCQDPCEKRSDNTKIKDYDYHASRCNTLQTKHFLRLLARVPCFRMLGICLSFRCKSHSHGNLFLVVSLLVSRNL